MTAAVSANADPLKGVARAVDAARHIFDDPSAPTRYEPQGLDEAAAAIDALASRFRSGGGTLTEIIDNARAAAEILSEDPFQALSEVIQNADDVDATRVRICLVHNALAIVHNGRPLRLREAHALAAPWLTTKREAAALVGRFGIGLATLRALADSFEMHSGDYHILYGAPTLEAIQARVPPDGLVSDSDTFLYVDLRDSDYVRERLIEWANKWDDAALLFLRSVQQVTFSTDTESQTLELTWDAATQSETLQGDPATIVRRRSAYATDGRHWAVFDTEFPSPAGVRRAHKATDATTPVAIALCATGHDRGMIHAGLPVTSLDSPLRVNAQFDPVASRQGVATNAWNESLVPLVSDMWLHAILSLFRTEPSSAWRGVPLDDVQPTRSAMVASIEASLLHTARTRASGDATIVVHGKPFWIGDLAFESEELAELVTPQEVADLGGREETLPTVARDTAGAWRRVLEDWNEWERGIPTAVTIEDALALLDDPQFAPERVLALTSAALAVGLESVLASANCVIRFDGTRGTPPTGHSFDFIMTSSTSLAVALGLGTRLHQCHLVDAGPAVDVLAWLKRRGSIVPPDDRSVLARLANAGRAGAQARRLDDSQLAALREALEGLGQAEWSRLGPGIGRAILIDAVSYDDRGQQTETTARPALAYVGRSIDRETDSFAIAAQNTPGLRWVASRYGSVLRSSLGRQGLGALRFLRLLGAETSPRLAPHPALDRKYSNSNRRGLPTWQIGTPRERANAVASLGGTHTLDDLRSADLDAVLNHISRDPDPSQRRRRAAAVVATLGRAWSNLIDSADVQVASAYYGWTVQGETRNWWLWKAATSAWLDDDSGHPQRPIDLRFRTPATLALHGDDSTEFVHRDFRDARTDVLEALGVGGEPSTAELCDALSQLRDEPGKIPGTSAVLYKAMADRLDAAAPTRGDITPAQLRHRFSGGAGLVQTNLGWRRPSDVLAGKPIFGNRAAFAPAITGTEGLWRRLGIRLPDTQACIDMLAAIGLEASVPDPETQAILLETQRELARLLGEQEHSHASLRRLAKVAVWTSIGWTNKRPVYAVHDPVVATGLAAVVPVWIPGGEVSQFSTLLRPLRLTEVPPTAGEVVARSAEADEDSTDLARKAIALLHDDLARNDPETASSLATTWPDFETFDVAVSDELSIRVPEVLLADGPAVVRVNAKANLLANRIHVADADVLGRLDGGARAIAGLFNADQRRVAQAWLAAMERAVADQRTEGLRMAEERAQEDQRKNDQLIEQQILAQQQAIARRRTRKPSELNDPLSGPTGDLAPAGSAPSPRHLVDPSMLRIITPEGEIVGTAAPPASAPSGGSAPLREPTHRASSPQQRSGLRVYTDLEKESVGLALALRVLQGDDAEVIDLRAQCGVGADAMDDLQRFYELKVYGKSEPDEVRLTDAEVRRALTTPEFFLVVVSGVEEGNPEQTVRIIAQPLTQLSKVDNRDMRLRGVREARSLIYRFGPDAQ